MEVTLAKLSKLQKAKRSYRNSKEWKSFRHKMNVKQKGIDPITGGKLSKSANLHHRHVTADEEEYQNITNEDDFVMLNLMTHKVLHWVYTYYKKYGREFLDRIEDELNKWY